MCFSFLVEVLSSLIENIAKLTIYCSEILTKPNFKLSPDLKNQQYFTIFHQFHHFTTRRRIIWCSSIKHGDRIDVIQ